jgi:hypothetical protein
MSCEAHGKFQFKSQNFTRLIRVFLNAFVALDKERPPDRHGLEGIRLGKRNLVPDHHVLVFMSLGVLADYYPAVADVFPRIRRPHNCPQVPKM